MKYTMLSKEIVEEEKFEERRGMINIYVCGDCKNVVTYLYADSGVTPIEIECDCCGKRMFSQFSSVRQPSKVWYRPKSLKELEDIADAAYTHCYADSNGKSIKAKILADYIEWYNIGGLFAISM